MIAFVCYTITMRHPDGLIDMTGQRVGYLTVERYMGSAKDGGALWECRCDCGKLVIRSRGKLKHGDEKSSCGCGLGIMIDLTGKKFGWLEVLKRDGKDDRGALWECKCKCGKITKMPTWKLKRARADFNCGCYMFGKRPGTAEMAIRSHAYNHFMHQARSRHLDVGISIDEYLKMADSPCHYCGEVAGCVTRSLRRKGWENLEYRHNGIDRLDSSRGYIPGNIVPCCGICNRYKYMGSTAEFIAHCRKVVAHQDSLKNR